uniref:Uncharacterized protein n=1 Tax=Romanomermis culicivorax TaxID=13658 RepID=A0A915HWE2_ROMCU
MEGVTGVEARSVLLYLCVDVKAIVSDSFVYNCSLLLLLSFVIVPSPWTVSKRNRFWDQTLLNRKPVLHILKTCCHLSPT